tara:strand:+ start:787 stop:1383 length:597 start_codon:yes stop_codon:yes gene_type:complete
VSAADRLSKREQTRLRVIQAAIDCIYQEGFNAAHTNRIAETAGVSWGVLQYHFGDKDGLLQAVLDHIFDNFSAALERTPVAGDDLRERVEQVIELIWSLVSGREYRVSVAILRNAGKDSSSAIDGEEKITQWSRRTSRLWDKLFADTGLEPGRSDVARQLLFAALRGMADEINPGSRSKKAIAEEHAALADAVTYLLS